MTLSRVFIAYHQLIMPKIPLITSSLNFLNQKKWWLLVIVIIALGGWGWYHQQQAKKPKLTFAHPTTQTLTQTIEASGVVDAKEKASLRFIAGGKVVYLGAKEGDDVKKWQTLATIDARDLKKRLEKNLNLYSIERNSWDQTLDDTKDRAIPKSEERTVNTDQLTLTNTVADVELSSIAISNVIMSSPITGVLVSAPTSLTGVVLSATDAFVVVNPSTLIFRAEVDEADIAAVKLGQKVNLTLDAFPNAPIETYVTKIGLVAIQTSSGTAFVVEASIPAEDGLSRYRLGMNGDAQIQLATRPNVLSVPLAATKERGSKFYVDVKTGQNTYQEREIQVGLQTEESVEIISGLTVTDEILLPN
ncbi:MAG TPA: hypothetical protein DEP87_02415 [Candidatus Pacebacteria bacterium]|nr:hypothetical protein [Candidatus Paceibacterota bacterium]